ncbi:MAG: hypothetical protein P8N49_05735 [Opitutales bacterium]|nr:hypothetical protein [Opitutales bacterium]
MYLNSQNIFKIGASNLLFFSLLCLTSCTEETEIQTYYIPPEYEGPVVAWKLPPNWGENPELSGPMAGSFHVKTNSGPQGRIGVMPFREAVSTLSITNMFGMELGYEKFKEDTLSQVLTTKKVGQKKFEWIHLTERDSPSDPKTALLAVLRQKDETWLFPFVANAALIDQEMNSFISFLDSTTVRAGKKVIRAPRPISAAPTDKPTGAPTWDAPDHWITGKASTVRIASYTVSDEDGNELDFSITSFPGDVGGLQSNVNRWLTQIELPKIESLESTPYLTSYSIDEKDAHLFLAENTEKTIYGALLFGKSRSWFFKIMGDTSLAKVEKENFLNLLTTVCFHDH